MLCRLAAPRPLSAKFHVHRRGDSISSLSASLLEREWMLLSPATPIHKISLSKPHQSQWPYGLAPSHFSYSNEPRPALGAEAIGAKEGTPSFYVVRDDLLHPLVNGNKARKLDALLPILQQYSATDVVITPSFSMFLLSLFKFSISFALAGHMWRMPECSYGSCW